MQFILVIFLSLFYLADCYAAPSTPSVSGTISTGSSVTITGSEFGTHLLRIESLQSNIEAGTTGNTVTKSGWDHSEWADYGPPPVYATDYYHSGSKSYKCSYTPVTSTPANYECTFNYDLPNTVSYGEQLYVSYWVRYSGYTSGDFQWKMLRIGETSTVSDNYPQLLLSNWGSQDYIAHNAGGANIWIGANNNPQIDGTWSRVEMLVRGNTNGSTNGTINLTRYTDTGTIYTFNSSAVGDLSPTHPSWGSVMLQNYLGNGTISGNNASIWVDDVYIQTGTPARVELCSGSTWANRGKCEIQVPSAWSASSITAMVNTGNFAAESTAYVYVVDSTGTANTLGTAVEIGASGGGGDTTPPVLSLLAPSGTLAAGTTSTTISLVTDEAAACRYSTTPGTAYADMTLSFDSSYAMSHSATVSGLTNGGSYTYQVRCINGIGLANTTDSPISFSVASSAGTAGTLSWQYSTYSADRSDVRIPINIVRTGGSTGSVTAQWSSNGQTATHNVDYYGNDGVTVTFADGVTAMPINTYGSGENGIEMIANGADDDRFFQMILSNPTGGATLGTTLATVTIEGDYVAPVPGMRVGEGRTPTGVGKTPITPVQ